jgi:hypothetical protein
MNAIAGYDGEWLGAALAKGTSAAPEAPCRVHNARNIPAANVVQNSFMPQTRALDAENLRRGFFSAERTEKYR